VVSAAGLDCSFWEKCEEQTKSDANRDPQDWRWRLSTHYYCLYYCMYYLVHVVNP